MKDREGEILTLDEVAAFLEAGKRTVCRLVQQSVIPASIWWQLALLPRRTGPLDCRQYRKNKTR